MTKTIILTLTLAIALLAPGLTPLTLHLKNKFKVSPDDMVPPSNLIPNRTVK